MTFAIVETGGKQYKVEEGKTISIEHVPGKKAGDSLVLDKVLLVDDGKATKLGTPHVNGAKVEATIETAGRGSKVVVIKYKAKSRYFKKRGHRQPFLKIKINSVK